MVSAEYPGNERKQGYCDAGSHRSLLVDNDELNLSLIQMSHPVQLVLTPRSVGVGCDNRCAGEPYRVELRYCICFRLSVILRRPLGLTNENDKESDVESPRAHFFETDLASSVQRIDRLRRKVESNIVVRVDGDQRIVNFLGGSAEIGRRHLGWI